MSHFRNEPGHIVDEVAVPNTQWLINAVQDYFQRSPVLDASDIRLNDIPDLEHLGDDKTVSFMVTIKLET